MEVHHHAHTSRKKWTHYFWEFLMLFLAVTAGFFVENQREHYIENKRAKKYAISLYNDLIKDSVILNSRIYWIEESNSKLDTLILLLSNPRKDTGYSDEIYELSGYAFGSLFFPPTTSTMNQLKSSGSVRYFHNSELIDNFSAYDSQLESLKLVNETNSYIQEEMRKFLSQFINLKYISRFSLVANSQEINYINPPIPEGSLKIYKTERNYLEQYANLCSLKQTDYNTKLSWLKGAKKMSENLIESLKKEYHLK